MSLAEIKHEMKTLTARERAELRAHLRLLDVQEDEGRQAELSGRAQHGTFIDQDEVRRRIEQQAGPRS